MARSSKSIRKKSAQARPHGVTFRTSDSTKRKLATLCKVNGYSQRQVLEILVGEAFKAYTSDNSLRISTP